MTQESVLNSATSSLIQEVFLLALLCFQSLRWFKEIIVKLNPVQKAFPPKRHAYCGKIAEEYPKKIIKGLFDNLHIIMHGYEYPEEHFLYISNLKY